MLLEAERLSKTFWRRRGIGRRAVGRRALHEVSLAVGAGRTLAIVGESGAGKSTLARVVLRLIEPDAGTIRFAGIDLLALSRRELRVQRRHAQMIFQDPYSSLDPRIAIGHSVGEPLKVHLGMNRADREQRSRQLLQRVGIEPEYAHRLPRQLSGGQLQRVAIARALALDPKVIVCDEAVAALDVSIRAQVLNLLLDLQEERGLSYLFIAHDLSIVEAFADEVMVMKDGSVVEQGPAQQVFARPAHTYTKTLLAARPGAALRVR